VTKEEKEVSFYEVRRRRNGNCGRKTGIGAEEAIVAERG